MEMASNLNLSLSLIVTGRQKAKPGEEQMEKDKKKKYERPKLNKIKLDPRCAVLGYCKTDSTSGPRTSGCGSPFNCKTHGS
jgi:hypothetical protein